MAQVDRTVIAKYLQGQASPPGKGRPSSPKTKSKQP
jgi:hypothetical protein